MGSGLDGAETVAVEKLQTAPMDAAKPVHLLQYSVEHRDEIAGRGFDDLQHLGRSRLSRKCLVALCCALIKLTLQISDKLLGISAVGRHPHLRTSSGQSLALIALPDKFGAFRLRVSV